MTQLVVATHNIEVVLKPKAAMDCLDAVLAEQPDLIALQEWYLPRNRLLRTRGVLGSAVPGLARLLRTPSAQAGEYVWSIPPFGDCIVGARAPRMSLIRQRVRWIDPPGFADKPERKAGLEPPRLANVGEYLDRETGRSVALISAHLSPGVESGGHYRRERPKLVSRHVAQMRRLQGIIDELRFAGHDVLCAGDFNYDGVQFAGLRSGWDTHKRLGTHGKRTIDDIFADRPSTWVRRIETASDHKAVVVGH